MRSLKFWSMTWLPRSPNLHATKCAVQCCGQPPYYVSELPEGGHDPLGWRDPLRHLIRELENLPRR